MKIDSTSRILVFAPHPDDEALATAGLLQRAAAAGAVVHIVFMTNGDNNPWPHRVLERRWKIEPHHRMHWAARRADEARASLATLRISSESVEFLSLPDQCITELLLRRRATVVTQLVRIFDEVQPNVLVAPAPFDLHPDHSALYVLVQSTVGRASRKDVKQLYYAVHTRGYHSDWNQIALELTPAEQQTKRRAILCHNTQVALSRKRFLRHASPVEVFWQPAISREMDSHHPVRGGRFSGRALVLQLQRRKPRRSFAGCTLLLAFDNESQGGESWSIQLARASGRVDISQAGDLAVALADLEVERSQAQLTIPLKSSERPTRLFVKLEEPTVFFDSAGWREIPVRRSQVISPVQVGAATSSTSARGLAR